MVGKSNIDEDSVLLKQRSDKPRKLGKENTREENWQIFKEYYLVKLVIGVLVAVFIVWQVIQIAFFNQRPAMSVMLLDVYISEEEQELFSAQAGKELGIDEKKEYVGITPNFKEEMLMPLMAASEVDVFLVSRTSFEAIVKAGFLMDLSEAAGIPEDKLCYGQTEEDTESHPYGVVVTDSAWLRQFGCVSTDDVIFGIAPNSKHLEMCQKFLGLIK